MRARFYNPVVARFTQEDTYRGDGLNLYAYCENNPVYYADPTGLEKTSVWGTDDKGRTTYTDGNGNTYKQDAKGNWHDASGKFCPDPTGRNQPVSPKAPTPNTTPTTRQTGRSGEGTAREMLRQNGWTILPDIKNGSDNGIDIVARSPDGRLGFFEVKSTEGDRVPGFGKDQQNMDTFVRRVLNQVLLSRTQDGTRNPYRTVDDSVYNAARQIRDEYLKAPDQVTGAVIEVYLQTGEVRISRWER